MSDERRNPLSWFTFNVKDYLTDTIELTAEGHGAYLLLMLKYYATETPLPDDNERLAAIARLSPEAWGKLRKFIAPYFKIGGGVWIHSRIDRTILEGHLKHTLAVDKAHKASAAAAAARATKDTTKASITQPSRSPPRTPPRSKVPDRTDKVSLVESSKDINTATSTESLEVSLEDTSETPHLQEQIHSLMREREEAPSQQVDEVDLQGKQEVPSFIHKEAEADEGPSDSPIGNDFFPDAAAIDVCHADGATDETISNEVVNFIATHQGRGTFSVNWQASWKLWWSRWREWKRKQDAIAAKDAAKAPPRIEVNTLTPEFMGVSCKRFLSNGSWPRSLGGEPGQPSCKVPTDVLITNGIDPKTGLPLPEKEKTT